MNSHILKHIYKAFNLLIVVQMTCSPLAFSYTNDYAEEIKTNKGSYKRYNVRTSDWQNLMKGVGIGLTEVQEMKRKRMEMLQQNEQNVQMMQQMTPKSAPSDFFPQCQVLQGKSDKIAGLCDSISSEAEMNEALMIFQVASQNANLYENHLLVGNKAGSQMGVQCMNEQASVLRTKLKDRLEELNILKRQLKEAEAAFEMSATNDLNRMKEINGLLTGEDGFEFNATNRDLGALFSDPNCKAVANFQSNEGRKKAKGLRGIREVVGTDVDAAQNLINKRSSIEKQLRTDVKDYVKILNNNLRSGADQPSFFSSAIKSDSTIIKKSIGLVKSDLDAQLGDVNAEIKNLGIQFDVSDINADISRQVRDWEMDQLNKCFTRNVTSNLKNFESSTYERNARVSSRQNIKDFFKSIQNILSQPDMSMDQKISLIQSEEKKWGYESLAVNMGVSIKGQRGNRAWKVSEAFQAYGQNCKTEFNSVRTGGYTNRQRVEKAKKLHAQVKQARQQYPQKVANEILNRVINCEGVDYAPTPADCSAAKINPQGDNFCLSQSLQCASSINSCYQKADKIVKAKEMEQTSLSRAYNQKVKTFKAQQYKLFKAVEGKFHQVATTLKGYFPGASFDVPFDIKVNPEGGEGAYQTKHGVKLLDSESFMANLTDNISKVEAAIQAQNKKIIGDVESVSDEYGGIIGEKLKTLKKNYTAEQEDWAALAKKCNDGANDFYQKQNEAIAEANEATAERNSKVAGFCSTVTAISHTPGCGGVSDLADSATEAAQEIGLPPGDSAKLGLLSSYGALCDQAQSHDEGGRSVASVVDATQICKKAEYKKSAQCKNWKAFNEKCDDDKYWEDMETIASFSSLGDSHSKITEQCETYVSGACTGQDETIECKNKVKKCDSFRSTTFTYTKAISLCGDDIGQKTEKEIELLEPLEELALNMAQEEEIAKMRKQVGEQRYEVCNAQDGSDRGVLRSFVEDVRDMGNDRSMASDL